MIWRWIGVETASLRPKSQALDCNILARSFAGFKRALPGVSAPQDSMWEGYMGGVQRF